MKLKIQHISLFVVIILSSCLNRIEPEPPQLIINPTDSIIEISIFKPVTYEIEIHSNELLQKFRMTSVPTIFKMDTSFQNISHDVQLKVNLNLPLITHGIAEDSIVELKFEAIDSYSSSFEIRKLKIIPGYPKIISKSIDLEMPPEGKMFYSFNLDSLFLVSDTLENYPEIAYLWSNNFHHVLCSPNSLWLKEQLQEYDYENFLMPKTKIQKIYSDWDDIDEQFLYEMFINESYLNGNPELGVGVVNLETNDILAFELEDGRKGVIEIALILENSISINFKIQNYDM